MWTLGKFVILTRNELIETVNDEKALAYRRGLHSKWKAKKKGNETERLLAAIAPSVVIPSRNAETYGEPLPVRSFVDDVLAANRGDATTPVGRILNAPTSYGDSLPPITAGKLPSEIGIFDARSAVSEDESQFNMKESEMEDAA